MILFTNLKFSVNDGEEELQELGVKIVKSDTDSLLNTSDKGCCYKFENSDEEFFKNFVLYTNQDSVDVVQNNIVEKFKMEESATQYIDFIREWSIKEGKKVKLNKTLMKRVFALCLMSKFIVPFGFENRKITENEKILRQAISQFTVTSFKSTNVDKLGRIYTDGDSVLDDIDQINKVKTAYQISKHVEDVTQLTPLEKTKLLWLLNKFPLILKDDPLVYEVISLCDDEKFIIISEETTRAYCKTLLDLEPNSEIFKHIVENFHFCLQGKRRITLAECIAINEKLLTLVTTNELLEMAEESFNVGGSLEELPTPYITRKLSTNIIDLKFLEQVENDTLVVILGDKTFFRVTEGVESLEDDVNIIYIDDENELDAMIKKKKYHYFRVVEGKLEWIESSADIDNLQKYHFSDSSIKEEDFSTNKLEIICSGPGMGKSTLMKSIKNQQSLWTIFLCPREHASHLINDNIDTFLEYILKMTERQYGFFDSCFLEVLLEKREVGFIWDGLDEIKEDTLEVVLNLIDNLKNKGFAQLVSARNHLKIKLETKLNVFSRSLNGLDQDEQRTFITERLNLAVEDDSIAKIMKCIEMVHFHDILEVPLHIYLLTDLLVKNWPKYSEILLQDIFPITDLYGYFFDEKFRIYCREKINLDDATDPLKQFIENTKRDRLENYERVALNLFFKKYRNEYSSFLEEIRTNSDYCGIITHVSSEGVPIFFHQSFGEYFVAKYLTKNYKNVDIEFLFKEEFTNVRFFFDLILAQKSPIHLAVLYKNLEALTSYVENFQDRDEGGRTPLHLASSWGLKFYLPSKKKVGLFQTKYYYSKDLIETKLTQSESVENRQIIQIFCGNCDPYQIDNIYKMDAFSYANKSSSLFPMLILCKIFQRNVKDFDNFRDVGSVLTQAAMLDYIEIFDIPDVAKMIKGKIQTLVVGSIQYNAIRVLKRLLYNYRPQLEGENHHLSVIHYACLVGNTEIVRLLLDSNANFNAVVKTVSPLYVACQYGHLQVVKMLIEENRVDVNQTDIFGNTPLFIAAAKGHIDIVKFLVENNADHSHLNKHGSSPFIVTANIDIITYFIQLGIDVKISNKFGVTALHSTASSGNVKIAQILLEKGAEVNATTKQGMTPLSWASKKGNCHLVGFLLDHGADVNIPNKDNCTPLYFATFNKHVDVVRVLIAAEADVNKTDNNGNSPLFVAVEKNHEDIVKILLNSGADTNVKNAKRLTPLYVSCQNGNVKIVEMLLQHGADASVRNFFGASIEQMARNKGQLEIVDLLLKYNK